MRTDYKDPWSHTLMAPSEIAIARCPECDREVFVETIETYEGSRSYSVSAFDENGRPVSVEPISPQWTLTHLVLWWPRVGSYGEHRWDASTFELRRVHSLHVHVK